MYQAPKSNWIRNFSQSIIVLAVYGVLACLLILLLGDYNQERIPAMVEATSNNPSGLIALILLVLNMTAIIFSLGLLRRSNRSRIGMVVVFLLGIAFLVWSIIHRSVLFTLLLSRADVSLNWIIQMNYLSVFLLALFIVILIWVIRILLSKRVREEMKVVHSSR